MQETIFSLMDFVAQGASQRFHFEYLPEYMILYLFS